MKKSKSLRPLAAGAAVGLCLAIVYFALFPPTSRPEDQRAFESARSDLWARYRAAPNQIEKSAIWNSSLSQMKSFAEHHGTEIKGWHAEVDSLTTSQGGDTAKLTLVSSASGVEIEFFQLEAISKGSALYDQIARLRVGQKVVFSASIHRYAERGLAETSLTEAGSLRAPEFKVTFQNVAPG